MDRKNKYRLMSESITSDSYLHQLYELKASQITIKYIFSDGNIIPIYGNLENLDELIKMRIDQIINFYSN